MAEYKRNELNEKLKAKEEAELRLSQNNSGEDKPLSLDDAQRVKVLSPTRLVVKRFLKNKLAIVGLSLLIFMFVMCFIGPIFYPYGQTQKFKTVGKIEREYSTSGEKDTYKKYRVFEGEDADFDELYMYHVDSIANKLDESGSSSYEEVFNNKHYLMERVSDEVIKLTYIGEEYKETVANVQLKIREVTGDNLSDEFKAAVTDAIFKTKQSTFEFDGVTYTVNKESATKATVTKIEFRGESQECLYATKLKFDAVDVTVPIEEAFELAALQAIYGSSGDNSSKFTYNGEEYTYSFEPGGEVNILNSKGAEFAYVSKYTTKTYRGEDTLSLEYKKHVAAVIDEMEKNGERSGSFEWEVPQLDPETEKFLYDENGNLVLSPETLTLTRKETSGEVRYYAGYSMNMVLISIYEAPSWNHILGTDGDGYDVFARVLFGGRISLLVGFIVVIIETILGVIMGGISGFFGGWVDTLIMRLVDIFYCIPTMPIMIIIASVFDYYQLHPYIRLVWMMVVLGILGWSGIARLVRGQILSLREQEFMIAAEATGLPTSRRIFKHLVPNVMPQLIVSMTMGLGGVILTESSLSFLGLGVKHPLATWGNMINSVSSIEAMRLYTYIWIPVGILICLTVIAFNFVGDGLRDAFDPKMKR